MLGAAWALFRGDAGLGGDNHSPAVTTTGIPGQPETDPASERVAAFIARWQGSGAAARANYQLFLSELYDAFEVPRPEPAAQDDAANACVFERTVVFRHADDTTSTGRIDLYKRGAFVLEATS